MGRPFLSNTIVEPVSAPVLAPKTVDEPSVWRESAFDVDSEEFTASAVWEWWAEDAHGILGGPTPVSSESQTVRDQALALLAAEESSDDTDSASETHVADDRTAREDQRVPLLFAANNEDGWTEVSRAVPSVDVDPAQPSANPHDPEVDDDEHDSEDDATDEDITPDSSPELRTRPLDRIEHLPRPPLPTNIVRPLIPFSTIPPTPTPAYPLAAR
jgi:hypothetical protein